MSYNPLIKICGLKPFDAIDAAIEGGASHVGFIFFEKSPRHVPSFELAAQLANHVAGRAKIVPVTVNASDAELADIVEAMKPDMLQLHGSETPERVAEVKAKFGLPVVKAFAIQAAEDLAKIGAYKGIADMFLFDAKAPKGADLPGGNGISFDWALLNDLPADVSYLLSGGLRLDNIEAALSQVKPLGIDLSSGVESAAGVKDLQLIKKFMERVQSIAAQI